MKALTPDRWKRRDDAAVGYSSMRYSSFLWLSSYISGSVTTVNAPEAAGSSRPDRAGRGR
jgi:hypothetical protein